MVQATTPGDATARGSQTDAGEWDEVSGDWSRDDAHRLWRQCSDAIHCYWLERAAPALEAHLVLKTDLFDEAFGDGLLKWFASRGIQATGCDLAQRTARFAVTARHCERAVTTDVRQLCFARGAFDCVISNSTLDHFCSVEDFHLSLDELAFVLSPGGHLLLTMDNPRHPLVGLRNLTPRFWRRAGVVPYQVGLTFSAPLLEGMLRRHGFEIVHCTAILHSPRVLLVPLCAWLERRYSWHALPPAFERILLSFERLASLPTCQFTGHFVGIIARKLP